MAARGRDLEGKAALVVGCGVPGGIGAASARALAEAGAKVTLADLASTNLEAVAGALKADGYEVASITVDVAQEASVQAMVAFAATTWGRLDAVVNVAAATNLVHLDGGVTEMDVAIWDQTFAVNARGPMLVCKHAIPVMLEGNGGAIVNISSGQSIRGDSHETAYAASKAAMNSLTRSVATIYGERGIRCNTISTGVIATTLMKQVVPPAMEALIVDCTLTGRLGTPENMADLVVFLASDRSANITAQTIQCDGGMLDVVPVRAGLKRLAADAQHLQPAHSA